MRLVLMGPPGAGKGTQAAVLAARVGVPHISTGDIFRANVSENTPLGAEARRYMDAGEYVPDSVTNAMVRGRLGEADCGPGFILDGYPRTPEQVGELDSMLREAGRALEAVVAIEVGEGEIVARLLKRAADQNRSDDTEDVVRRRLEVYREQTAPLLAIYRQRGLLKTVDGIGATDEVTDRILAAIGR